MIHAMVPLRSHLACRSQRSVVRLCSGSSSSFGSTIRGMKPPAKSSVARRFWDSAALLEEASKIIIGSGHMGLKRSMETAHALTSLSLESVSSGPVTAPELLRRLFERLGVTYIKLGQFVASSPSLFPEEYVLEFQKCLDQTVPVPFGEISKVLREELGDLEGKFEYINPEPLASASIAQVHVAKLRGSGQEVCLKVQKPGVKDILETDLNFIYLGVRFLELINPDLTRASLGDIVGDIHRSMIAEVDFLAEAENVKSFNRFLEQCNIGRIVAPYVYESLTTKRVLTMERFEGVALTDLQSIRLYTQAPPEETLVLVLNTWLASVLGCESFHADVHAGNLMLLRDGRVGFIDFGIVGRIRPETWGAVRSFLVSVQALDFNTMASSLVTMGATDVEVNISALAQDLRELFSTLAQVEPHVIVNQEPGHEHLHKSVMVDQIQVNRLLIDVVRVGDAHGLRFPREFGLLLKQLLYFDRYAKILAPELDMLRDQRLTALSHASSNDGRSYFTESS